MDADTSTITAASMQRVLDQLVFETHPLLDKSVWTLSYRGEIIFFDQDEMIAIAEHVSTMLVKTGELCRSDLSNADRDHVFRRRIATYAATHVPESWTQ